MVLVGNLRLSIIETDLEKFEVIGLIFEFSAVAYPTEQNKKAKYGGTLSRFTLERQFYVYFHKDNFCH